MMWSWYRGCHKGFARLNLDIDNWLSSIKSSILVTTADLYPAINDEIDFFCRWKEPLESRNGFVWFFCFCECACGRDVRPYVSTLKSKSSFFPPSSCGITNSTIA